MPLYGFSPNAQVLRSLVNSALLLLPVRGEGGAKAPDEGRSARAERFRCRTLASLGPSFGLRTSSPTQMRWERKTRAWKPFIA